MEDITERKNLEREVEKHRQNLEMLVNERTEALASANQVLTAIRKKEKFRSKQQFLIIKS